MTDQPELVPDVIDAIAEIEQTHPSDLDITLYDHIDPDALTLLATSEHTDWRLQFELPDYTVEVHGDGSVFVDGTVVQTTNSPPPSVGSASR